MGEQLGQHFLRDKEVIADMLQAADVSEGDTILEIGPGRGVLTKALLETGAAVVGVEKDPEMIETLRNRFKSALSSGQLSLEKADIRDITHEQLIEEADYKLVANIPYYITGQILQQFLTAQVQPDSMTLLVQKEVAERITDDAKESLLSLSIKAYGAPSLIRTVPAEAFEPAPDVDSAIIHIGNISRDFFEKHTLDEDDLFALIKAGFAHKRKTLANNLANAGWDKSYIEDILTDLSLGEKVRAEILNLNEWAKLIISINDI